ncbi:30S ribosomal protein S9 [Candidatus Peregrinibacteria bacterium]|nr:30S ribosomal protein S9 [Candidatus Peregrinibacteria bacterium]
MPKAATPQPAAAKKSKYFYAVGKRKSSIASVRLYKGTGEITINNKPIGEYLTVKTLIGTAKTPLTLTGSTQKFDISARINGGGVSSQAEALRHGISKALVEADPLNKPTLRKAGLLTRDSRTKERKKYGLKRARKGPQFSKR